MPPAITKQDETQTATGADVRARATADDATGVATGDAASRGTSSVGSPHVGAAIVARDLSKTYPVPLARLKRVFRRKSDEPTVALRDVSLEIREGEIFGLIGRNGAGKTTFAKIIATLVQPTSGSVTVHGFDSVRDEERVRAQVGLASAEERSFYWRLTIRQNLMFFARLYGMDDRRARARIKEMIELFELGDQSRQRFGQLSTGNKQRVILARAMLNDPPVLLLDEPTRSLDPLAAAEMRSTIRRLAAATPPKTVLLTSHNLAEIEELCDRVAVISRGTIRALGTPQRLRVEHRPTEIVRVTARAVPREAAERALRPLALAGFSARGGEGGEVVFEFTREVEDAQLDAALGALRGAGGEVVSVEAERATLLDVLERYERAHESEPPADGKGAAK